MNKIFSFLLAALICSVPEGVRGQDREDFGQLEIRKVEKLFVDDVHPGVGGQRVADVYFRALTRYGKPVPDLRERDLEVRIDAKRVEPRKGALRTIEQAEVGVTCVLVLDVSRTMTGEPFERARDAAIQFLSRLGAVHDKVAIVTISGSVEVVSSFDDSHTKAEGRLRRVEVDQSSLSTVFYDGLYRAVELVRKNSNLPRRSFAIAFSDGRDGGSNHSLRQVIELAKGEETEARIPIFTVAYTGRGGGGTDVLRELSESTGGDSSRASQLAGFFDDTLEQMRKSYVLRLPQGMDGRRHAVELAVEGLRDGRPALYPKIGRPLWQYASAGALGLLVLILFFLLLRPRSPGRLRFLNGPLAEESARLRMGRTRIGALADNDVVILSEKISRYHAEIRATRKSVEIEDLRSTNGTLVNGAAVTSSPLRAGDRVRLGDVDMIFDA